MALFSLLEANKNISKKALLLRCKTQNIPIIKMKQTHSVSCYNISPKTLPKTSLTTIQNVDALITTTPQLGLCVKFADCMPIIIFHPTQVLSVIHAGRKGTQSGILSQTLTTLINLTQSKTNYQIIFGPCLCKHCHQINPSPPQYFNLYKENLTQLQSHLNLSKNTLSSYTHCTKTSSSYFSYRGDDKTKKRNMWIAYLH